MKISKIDRIMLMDQFNKTNSKTKVKPSKKQTEKRDELELSEKAKQLQQERDEKFLVHDNEETKKNTRKSVKRAEILPFKKRKDFASRYSVGTE